jgi:hypothetical protein
LKENRSFADGLAWLVIRYTNPCILGVFVLVFIALTKSSNFSSIVLSEVVLFMSFVVLPLAYVYLRTSGFKNGERLLGDPTLFLRQHPKDILVLGMGCGLPCLGVLVFFGAPAILIATLAALFISSLIIALFNLFYRVSYHLAALIVIVIAAVTAWGRGLFVLLIVVPLVGWAKYRTGQHNAVQMIMATAIATVATITIFYFFFP